MSMAQLIMQLRHIYVLVMIGDDFMDASAGQRPQKMWNMQFAMIFAVEVLLQLGMYILQPNLSNYLITLGASITTAGFIVGFNYGTSLVLRFVNGFVCDLFDKKALLVLSCACFACASLGIALAVSPAMVGFFRVVQGVAFVMKSSVVVSMASMVVPKKMVGSGVGIMGLGFTVACSVGPAIGDLVGTTYGYRTSCAMAVASFICALCVALAFKAPAMSQGSWRNLECGKWGAVKLRIGQMKLSELLYVPTLPVTVAIWLAFAAQSMMLALTLTFASIQGVSHAFVYYIAYAAVAVFSKPLAGRMLDKRGVLFVLVPMSLVSCSAMVLLALNFSTVTLGVAGAMMGLGQGSVWSCLQGEAVRRAPVGKTGRSVNMFYIGSDTTQCFAPFFFALLFNGLGVPVCFLAAAVCIVLSVAAYVLSSRLLCGAETKNGGVPAAEED